MWCYTYITMTETELKKEASALSKYVRVTDYLSIAQLFLRDNFFLDTKLEKTHIKHRLLGHWGTCPGINYVYAHINRLIQKTDNDFLYIVGPGHGFPAFQANLFVEKSLTHVYPEKIPYTKAGMEEICKEFSTPYGYPSHLNPEAPGVVLEGGELGYSLSVAGGTVLDNPNLITVCLIGDGEAETGPLAASWNINRFINPNEDGAVLPVLHLNGYKISGPTVFGRMEDIEIQKFFEGLGYRPLFIDYTKDEDIYTQGIKVFDSAYEHISMAKTISKSGTDSEHPLWPVIILKTPKGLGAPLYIGKEKIVGNHLSHQVIFDNLHHDEKQIALLQDWMESYNIKELVTFKESGELLFDTAIASFIPKEGRSVGTSPYAHGEQVKELTLPDVAKSFCDFEKKSCLTTDSMQTAGEYIADVFESNKEEKNFRLFSPDETYSNHLQAIFEKTERAWQWPIEEWDRDMSKTGRVLEILSEHTLFGILWGYTMTGRHGIFATYEAFAQIVASMADQYAKFIKIAKKVPFRKPLPGLTVLLSSLLERQDHNGFSHQNPSFIASMLDRDLDIVNLYFPADKNMMLSATHESLQSKNALNIIVCGKKMSRNWLSKEEVKKQSRDGIMAWDFLSDKNPDLIVATCGDYVTEEAAIGVKLFRTIIPNVAVRFVNVYRLDMLAEALENPDKKAILKECLTKDKPIVFNFHGYPTTVKKLLFNHHVSERIIINGYQEEGSTTSPFDLGARNGLSRFHLVKDLALLANSKKLISNEELHTTTKQMDEKLAWEKEYIKEHDIDPDEIRNWEI